MMKILTVIGARPQFIKAAAVSRALMQHTHVNEVIVHTGQHFDENMSQIFFDQLSIPRPAYNLDIHSLSHGAMTGRMLEQLEQVFLQEKPDWVLVYGDTNSTLAGALAASKLHIRVAHVEAGLRSFNMLMPEEINRILTDRISHLLFCPTAEAVKNLQQEGFPHPHCRVEQTGDVMYDAAMFYSSQAQQPSAPLPLNFVLATIHRAENTDEPNRLKAIFKAFARIAQHNPIVIPLHPRTRKILKDQQIAEQQPGLHIIEPVGYLEMIWLLQNCSMVMTDSGGLQKEAYFFQKNCITLREETEWVELIQHGANQLAGADYQRITQAFEAFSSQGFKARPGLYGDGKSAEQIAQILLSNP